MRTSHSSTNTTPYRAVTAERTTWTTCNWYTGGATMRTMRGPDTGRQRLEPDDEQSSRPVLRGLGLGNEARLPDTCWSRAADAPRSRPGRVADPGGCKPPPAPRRFHPAGAVPVPVSTCLARSAGVALASNLVPNLTLQRFFEDQLGGQKHQARSLGGCPQPAIHDGPKPLACPLRCRYSLHRDAPWGPGDNRRPVLLPHLRQGASQPQFPAILGLQPYRQSGTQAGG